MHLWSPLIKLCVTTVFPVLWFVGSSTGINMSMLYASLVKFPLLLLVNVKLIQMVGDTACFPGFFIWSGLFRWNCLPSRFWYSSHWERLFGQFIQRDAICILHPCAGLSVSVPGEKAQGSLHHGDPRLRVSLLEKQQETGCFCIKNSYYKQAREEIRTPTYLILQRGLLLSTWPGFSLENEALGRAGLGRSSQCQGWRDGNAASNTCFQFPVAKKRLWLVIQMPVLNILER